MDPDGQSTPSPVKEKKPGMNDMMTEVVDISVRAHGIHSGTSSYDQKGHCGHSRTNSFEHRGHSRTNSFEQRRQAFLSKEACRRLTAFFPIFSHGSSKDAKRSSPSCFGGGACVGGFQSVDKAQEIDSESDSSFIRAGVISMENPPQQMQRRSTSGVFSYESDNTVVGEHHARSFSAPIYEVETHNGRQQKTRMQNTAPDRSYYTPPRAGHARRVQCRRAKELRTVGGDLIDGSPDRELGLITDESGDKPRLLIAISNLLEKLLSQIATPSLPEDHPDPVMAASASLFYGKCVPPISISDYIGRMYQYGQCCPASFLHAIVYMDRLVDKFGAVMAPNKLNVHRILLTGVIVGAKFLDDRVFSNAYYARVGGVSTQEMNRMEREFIQLLDHRMSVAIPTLEAYCSGMERSLEKDQLKISKPKTTIISQNCESDMDTQQACCDSDVTMSTA